MPTETQKAGQTVWITGASSGLGLHTAQALRKAGFRVIAGARAFESPERRADENCLPLDVTKQESIDVFVEKALQFLNRNLWVLIDLILILRWILHIAS